MHFYCFESPSIAHNFGTTAPIQVGFSAKCTSPNEHLSNRKLKMSHVWVPTDFPSRITYSSEEKFDNNRQISTSKSLFLVSGTYCIIIHIHSQDGTSAGNYCWEEQWVFHIIIWLRLSVNFPTSTHLPLLKHSCQTFLFFKHFVFSAGCCWATLWPKYHVIMCTMINMHAKNKMPKIKYVSLNFIKLQEWMWHHYMISKAINHNYKNDNKIQVHKKVACIFKMLYATSIP